MPSAVRLRVLCSKTSKQHTIGRIIDSPLGQLLILTVELGHPGGPAATEWTFERTSDAAAGAWPARCPKCEKTYPVVVPAELFKAMDDGQKAVVLTAEGMWSDPLGVLGRRAAQR